VPSKYRQRMDDRLIKCVVHRTSYNGILKTKTREGSAWCSRGRLWKYRTNMSHILGVNPWSACSLNAEKVLHAFNMLLHVCVLPIPYRGSTYLLTYRFLNLAHILARRQHALASTAGCECGSNQVFCCCLTSNKDYSVIFTLKQTSVDVMYFQWN